MLPTNGLSTSEAQARLKTYGRNEIQNVGRNTPLLILFRQVRSNFIIYLLVAAAIMSFLAGEGITGYTVLVVVGLVIATGFWQEYRSERAIQALKSMLVPVSLVRRDGREVEIQSAEIVPGDILVLRTGERVPADATVREERELRVNEAVLTGESQDVRKSVPGPSTKAGPEHLIFMGTFVVYGRCLAEVVHTGMNTKFGQISRSISLSEKELPLQQKINRIGRTMVIVALSIALATGAVMLVREPVLTQDALIRIFILMIALSVSAFPEGFPVVLISTLSAGAHRMAKRNALVNRMSIIETLGETSVICADKTGTITRGEMTAIRLFVDRQELKISGAGYEAIGNFYQAGQPVSPVSEPVIKTMLQAAIICNDATIERTGEDMLFRVRGTPTEGALLIAGAKAGLYRDDLETTRIEEIPFSSERKIMSVLCQTRAGKYVYVKGAPEVVLEKCTQVERRRGPQLMTSEERRLTLAASERMTRESLRTLAVAYKPHASGEKDGFEKDLVWLGLFGLEDAPRPEAKGAIDECRRAGIKVKMITGDNLETAVAIGRQVGLTGPTLVGANLDELTDDELERMIPEVAILARVRPEHKLRVVRALKRRGEVVTMTGDGVNDAPALKEAHIGIAMGKNGTDVSRSVADLTLRDDNFATIVTAIHEGRTIFKNIRKFISYQLSCNVAELIIVFTGTLVAPWLGWPVPLLLALQILFMNLVTDNLPAITLGFNRVSEDVMSVHPRRNTNVLTRPLFLVTIGTGAILAGLVLLIFYLSFNVLGFDQATARTIALVSLICLEIASAFNFRSFRKGVFSRSLLANPWLVYASLISLAATLMIVYTPLGVHFGASPISLLGWLLAVGAAVMLWVVYDLLKLLNAKTRRLEFER